MNNSGINGRSLQTQQRPLDRNPCPTESKMDSEYNRLEDTTVAASRKSRLRIVKSILLFSTWVCMGFWISVPPPCMDVLKDITKSNYEQISIPLAINMIGVTVGSLLVGVTVDKLEKWFDIVIFVDILLGGLSFAVIPWLSNLTLMSLAFFVNGVAGGGWSSAANAHTVSMWGKDAASPMLLIHMGHSLGTVVGPLLLEPFLPLSIRHYKDNTTRKQSELYDPEDALGLVSSNIYHDDEASHGANSSHNYVGDVRIPYAIAGCYSVFISLMYLIYFNCSRKPSKGTRSSTPSPVSVQNQRSLAHILLPRSCTGGNWSFSTVMLVLVLFVYLLMIGKDISVSNYVEPLAVHTPTLNFTMREADLIVTLHFATYAAGRMIVAILAKFFPITILIFLEASGVIITQVALVTVGLKCKTNFWLTTTAFALMVGPLMPSGYTWIDRYVQMTGFAYGVLNAGIGLGGFLFQWASGYIYNRYSPVNLLYLSLGCGVGLIIALSVTQLIGSCHGDRFSKEAEIVSVVTPVDSPVQGTGSHDCAVLLQHEVCENSSVQRLHNAI